MKIITQKVSLVHLQCLIKINYVCFAGGLGEAVSSAVADVSNIIVKSLAVREIPRSGPPTVLIEKYGIGANSIVKAVLEILKN